MQTYKLANNTNLLYYKSIFEDDKPFPIRRELKEIKILQYKSNLVVIK